MFIDRNHTFNIRIYILYLFVFFLNIENWLPGAVTTALSRPVIILGASYIILSLFNFSKSFRVNKLTAFLLPITFLWLWLLILSAFLFIFTESPYFDINYTLLFCIVLFWIICNDLTNIKGLRDNILMIFAINGIFLSLLSFFGIGADIGHMGREFLLGMNANIIAMAGVETIIIIGYIVIDNPRKFSSNRFYLLLTLPLLLQMIAKTGSKGALLLLIIGCLTYIIFLNKPLKFKLPIVITIVALLAIGYQYTLKNEIMKERWNQLIIDKDTTGRFAHWHNALTVFSNHPITGVGEAKYLEQSGSLFTDESDPHNVYLYVLATSGIIGFTFFSFFIAKLSFTAIKSINIWDSSMPIVLLIILLLFIFKAGGGLTSKVVWTYFALIAYSVNNVTPDSRRFYIHQKHSQI